MSTSGYYRATGIICFWALAVVPQPVVGQSDATDTDRARERAAAEALFEAGHAAMDQGDYDTACQKFEASMALDPAPGTLLNLGNCEEKRGRVASAWERYVAAQRDLPSSDRRWQFAQEKIEALEARVPRLTIVLAEDAPETTQVFREEIDLTPTLGEALPLDPGSYSIRARAEGHEERVFEVELALGESEELAVGPGDRLPEPEPQTAGEVRRYGPLTKREWGYVAGGVGIAGIATALTTGALAYRQKTTMDEHCSASEGTCDSKGDEARLTGGRLATVANIAGGVGIAALGAGLYLVLTSDAPPPDAAMDLPLLARPGLAARLSWVTAPGTAGIELTGEFR